MSVAMISAVSVVIGQEQLPAEASQTFDLKVDAEGVHPGEASRGFSVRDVAAAQQFGQTIGVADWLGPLAPIGLSPFFGISCLAAMANWGEFIGLSPDNNPLLSETSPLRNPAVFWTFFILTLLTSIPRLTKVSKPFAQAIDQVEAWAGIITLVALKIILSASSQDPDGVELVELGFMSVTVDTLLIIAAAVNVFVINAVKFFFEVLIWITPVPAIDAMFEVANKSVCAVLMAIYGFSPTVATVINLLMLAVSLFVFRWVYRREVFFRSLLIDALWGIIRPPNKFDPAELVVFPVSEFGSIAARARCKLTRTDDGWAVTWPRLLRRDVVVHLADADCSAEVVAGYFANCVKFSGKQSADLSFSRRYSSCLPEIAQVLTVKIAHSADAEPQTRASLKAELA